MNHHIIEMYLGSDKVHAPAEEVPCTLCIGGSVGPRTCLDTVVREKLLFPVENWTLVIKPIAFCCTDGALPYNTHKKHKVHRMTVKKIQSGYIYCCFRQILHMKSRKFSSMLDTAFL